MSLTLLFFMWHFLAENWCSGHRRVLRPHIWNLQELRVRLHPLLPVQRLNEEFFFNPTEREQEKLLNNLFPGRGRNSGPWTRRSSSYGVLPARTAVINTCAFYSLRAAALPMYQLPPSHLPSPSPSPWPPCPPSPITPYRSAGRCCLCCCRCRDNEMMMNEKKNKKKHKQKKNKKLHHDCLKTLNEACTDVAWYDWRISFFFLCLGCGLDWLFNNSYDVTLARCLYPPHLTHPHSP